MKTTGVSFSTAVTPAVSQPWLCWRRLPQHFPGLRRRSSEPDDGSGVLKLDLRASVDVPRRSRGR